MVEAGRAQFPVQYRAPEADYGLGNEGSDESVLNPVQLFWYIIHHRWLIAAFLASGLVAGTVFTWMQTPVFQARATVEVLVAGAKVLDDIDSVQTAIDLRSLETQRTKLLSRDLARRVVFELGLADNADFIAPETSFSLGNLVNRALRRDNERALEDTTAEQRQTMAIARIVEGLSAEFIRGTTVLSVRFRHPDPGLAATVVNQVATSFIDQSVDQRGETSELARQFIQQQVAETKLQLEASERELVDYAQAEGILLDTDENSLITANIAEVNRAINAITQEIFTAERLVEQIDNGGSATLPAVFESESIQTAKQTLAELRASYQEKLATLKPAFPEMRRLRAQIDELTAQMNAEIGSIASSVRLNAEQLVQRRSVLQAELARLEEQQVEFQRKNVRYTILKREVDSNRAQYESLVTKLNEVGVGSDLRRANAAIIDTAIRPVRPVSPSLPINLALAVVLAALVAAAVIYILELLNNTFSNPDQIESDLRLPVLGIIPAVAPTEIEAAAEDINSAYSEAYRTLRTSIQFSSPDGAAKIYVVTSSEPSEGKSASVFKLSEEFAALGKRVVVIDADLRKAKLHRLFKTDNTVGLTNLLTSIPRSNIETPVFRKTRNPFVEFVAAGTLPPNPANLLASERMGIILRFCANRYDVVIVDTPPVMGLADAVILSRYADATLMVVSAKQVKRKAAKNAIKRLSAASANIIGVAMTKFEVDRLDYNYSYRYMRYNYYSYGDDAPQLTGPKNGSAPGLAHPGNIVTRAWNKLVSAFNGVASDRRDA